MYMVQREYGTEFSVMFSSLGLGGTDSAILKIESLLIINYSSIIYIFLIAPPINIRLYNNIAHAYDKVMKFRNYKYRRYIAYRIKCRSISE